MSQNIDICPSCISMTKNGKILIYFFYYFSIFHKKKFGTYITILRQGSLQLNVFYGYVKCYAWELIYKRDILVQTKKQIDFKIPGSVISVSLPMSI